MAFSQLEYSQMSHALKPLSNIPQFSNMISSHLRSIGGENGNQRTWIAVFDYPDCVREFDGKKWTIVEDKRIIQKPMIMAENINI
jgi:hypothetical protein